MALRILRATNTYLNTVYPCRSFAKISASIIQDQTQFIKNDKPICPGNAFTLFLETQPRDGKSLKRHLYDSGCKWNTLSVKERRVFQQRAEHLEKKYKDDIIDWKNRMKERGNVDLIEKHHRLTNAKNLTVLRGRNLLKEERHHKEENLSLKEEIRSDTKKIHPFRNRPRKEIREENSTKKVSEKEIWREVKEPTRERKKAHKRSSKNGIPYIEKSIDLESPQHYHKVVYE